MTILIRISIDYHQNCQKEVILSIEINACDNEANSKLGDAFLSFE